MRLGELAGLLGAEPVLPSSLSPAVLTEEVRGVAPIDKAQPGQVSFLVNPEYERFIATTEAAAVIVARAHPACKRPQLVHKNPYWAFAKAAQCFYAPRRPQEGISPLAFVSPEATIGKGVAIEPFVYVERGARLGDGVALFAGVYIGANAEIGKDTVLRANVVIEDRCRLGSRVLVHAGSVIGADGFGFAPSEDDIAKVPQVGIVVIEDDVEIGAACTIDRAALGETRIGRGTKLDSHVHIGHNVRTGEHCMFSGFTGIAGSARLGNRIVTGGHSGISGHIEVGDRVVLASMSGLTKTTKEPGTYMGFPATEASQWKKQEVYVRRLPQLSERLKALEARLAELESRSG